MSTAIDIIAAIILGVIVIISFWKSDRNTSDRPRQYHDPDLLKAKKMMQAPKQSNSNKKQ